MGGMSELRLASYVGDTVSRVSRLRYRVGDQVVSAANEGSVELTFSSGATLFCESGPDGETLRTQDTPWVDPFAGPMSPENEEYVRTSGKWSRYDVSAEQPFADLLGRQVTDIATVTGTSGKRYGLVLNVSGHLLALYVNADELHVQLLT
jgi:hypothetical protein